MLSRKKTLQVPAKAAFPGIRRIENGNTAILEVESQTCEAIGIRPAAAGAGYHPWSRPLERATEPRHTTLRAVETSHALAGLVVGFASTGLRAAAFTRGRTLTEMHESLVASVRKRLTFVVNHTCEANDRHMASSQGSHDDYFSVADCGVFQLFAKNVQEAVDLTLIAHRIAEVSLNPGVCAKDGDLTGRSIQNLLMPESALIEHYLGSPDDIVDSPTTAQAILLGGKRRRVPAFFDIDRPLGIGATLDRDDAYKALASQDTFFFNHIAGIADDAMAMFEKLTGRSHARVSGYRIEDAQYVIVAQGAVISDLERIVDSLRKANIPAGLLNLTMFRPFPGDLVSHLLKGKKAVTVLERTHCAQAEDLHMLKEIRCALDKAVANGARHREESSYPGYAVYDKIMDRPRLFSGIYGGAGSFPSFNELYTVFTNMLPKGGKKNGFYLGVHLDRPVLRFPRLERLQQTIRKEYANLAQRSLNEEESNVLPEFLPVSYTFQTHTETEWEGSFSGGTLAKALCEALNWQVKSVPQFSHHRGQRSCIYTVSHTTGEVPLSGGTGRVDAMMVSTHALLKGTLALKTLRNEGVLVVHSEKKPELWWADVPVKIRRQIQSQQLRIYFLDARRTAEQAASKTYYADRLMVHALVGAFLKVYPHVPLSHLGLVLDHYRRNLGKVFGDNEVLLGDHIQAVKGGIEAVTPLTWESFEAKEEQPTPEPEAPWTVREVVRNENTIYDLSRFWNSVGYMHETGQEDLTLADPFVATGMIPPRSSVFRNLLPFRTQTPRLIPGKCTACGACWTYCPDSSLPITIQDLPSLVNTAVETCIAYGHSMVQFQRIAQNLVILAQKNLAKKETQYGTLDDLLTDAFSRLIEMMKPKEDQQKALSEELNHLLSVVKSFPIVKTDTFFNIPENDKKGSGLLFSMAVNLNTCKECRLCVDVCPEHAMEMVDLDEETPGISQTNWAFLMRLPEVSSDKIRVFTSADHPESLAYQFLNKRVYHSLLGGDMAMPGNGVKTAVHLIVGTIEATKLPHLYQWRQQVGNLISDLKDKIQSVVTKTIKIDDFGDFGVKLAGFKGDTLNLDALAGILQGETPRGFDKAAVERLTGIIDKLSTLRDRFETGNHGDGRARLAMSMGTDPLLHWMRSYPYNTVSFPWIRHRSSEEPAVSIGIFEGVMKQVASGFRTVRIARLLLNDKYDPKTHDPLFEHFGWKDFTDEEWALCPTFLVLANKNDEQISQLFRTRLPIKVIVINTQRSCREEHRFVPDEPGLMALAHRNVFVLQSTTGNPGHLMQGVRDGLAYQGPALLHIYATDPYEQGLTPKQAVEQSKRAYRSRAFPLYVYNPERGAGFLESLNLDGNPDVEKDWATQTFEFDDETDLTAGSSHLLTFADWAFSEKHLQNHFRSVADQNLSASLVSLSDYLDLSVSERKDKVPFILITDNNGRLVQKVVSQEMVAETIRRLSTWQALLELAGIRSNLAAFYAEKARMEMDLQLVRKTEETEAAYASRLAEMDRPHAERYQDQLVQQLLLLSGYGPDTGKTHMTLREYANLGVVNDPES